MNFLSIDIGSTGCKCQLFDQKGEILEYLFKEYSLLERDNEIYVDIEQVVTNLKELIKGVKNPFDSCAISSFGESFVLLDEDDNVLFLPMIYTDPRGEREAEDVLKLFSEEEIFEITGTCPQSLFSVYKLLYIKNNCPEIFKKAKKMMLIGDYLGYILTGKAVIDYSLASRTGIFDVKNKCFSQKLMEGLGIDNILMSEPQLAGSRVGEFLDGVSAELQIKNKPVLLLGAHDQVATALGAGVLEIGEGVDGLGTVECITTLFDISAQNIELGKMGYPIVPFAIDGIYCTYILNYSCGSLVNWVRKNIMHNYVGSDQEFFEYMEKNMTDTFDGVYVLPYFGGAATPYQDINAKGAVFGLTTQTSDHQLYKAALLGTSLEMRLNSLVTEKYGICQKRLVATGGGARSDKWLQMKADVQQVEIKRLRSSEGGLCGIAMLQAVGMGACKDLFEARDIFVQYKGEFMPCEDKYRDVFENYKKLYGLTKELK